MSNAMRAYFRLVTSHPYLPTIDKYKIYDSSIPIFGILGYGLLVLSRCGYAIHRLNTISSNDSSSSACALLALHPIRFFKVRRVARLRCSLAAQPKHNAVYNKRNSKIDIRNNLLTYVVYCLNQQRKQRLIPTTKK